MTDNDKISGLSDSLNKSDVPYNMLSKNSYIELFGNSKMSIEGRYSIQEYTEEFIKLKLGKSTLLVYGRSLGLHNVNSEGFAITGKISQIEFE